MHSAKTGNFIWELKMKWTKTNLLGPSRVWSIIAGVVPHYLVLQSPPSMSFSLASKTRWI